MSQPVVVSGAGVFSPLGDSLESLRAALMAGQSGVRTLRDPHLGSDFPVPYAGFIDKKLFSGKDISEQFSQLAKELTLQAVASAPHALEFDAIILGSRDECGFLAGIEAEKNHHLDESLINAMRPESTAEAVSDLLTSMGHIPPPPSHVICVLGACATSALALGMAFHRIRAGDWKRVLVLAIDVELHPLALTSYYLLGAMTTSPVSPESASCPFSTNRSGFVLGEAAAAVILESKTEANNRGAAILGEVVGASNTSDAWHLTAGREDCAGTIRAMEIAIQDAGISKNQISYINAHGTSTQVGDRLECLAIKATFGPRAYQIPISALKSQIGHARIASGMMAVIASLIMLREQKMAPTLNYIGVDPDCDLDFVPNTARSAKLDYVLVNSFGFGGQNACLVLKKAEA